MELSVRNRAYQIVVIIVVFFVSVNAANIYEDLELLGQTLTIVRDSYVDEVDLEYLINEAIRGMVEYLDEHSTYLDTEDVRLFEEEAHGRFGGIGVMVGLREGVPTIVAPIERSPAWSVGLRPGDSILEIDGIATLGMSLRSAVARLRGSIGSTVTITVRRPGISGFTRLEIEREEIIIPTVPYYFTVEADNGEKIGYIRFSMFIHSSTQALRTAIDGLVKQDVSGLVIDLRGNPGGLLSEATSAADLLMPPGELICYTIGNKGAAFNEYSSAEPPLVKSQRVVLLVDEGSASGSEILSGALQSSEEGIVVGKRTYGKGTVQEIRYLEDGSAIKITTARWFTPDGVCVDMNLGTVDSLRFPDAKPMKGIIPNIAVKSAPGDTMILELTAGLIQQFLDSNAEKIGSGSTDISDFSVDTTIVHEFSDWLSLDSELKESYPDSVRDMIREIAERKEAVRRYIGTEIVRRKWGDEGVARYDCETDPFVITGIDIAADAIRFENSLPLRATKLDSLQG